MDYIIREGLFNLAALYDREVDESMEALWKSSLASLDPRLVEAAFLHIMKNFIPTMACPFPTPAHMLEFFAALESTGDQWSAETSWQKAIAALDHQHPDLGWRGAPLEPRVLRAVQAAGGLNYIYRASAEQLVWAKKAFVAHYQLELKMEQYRELLTPELRPLLADAVRQLAKNHG